MSRDAPILRDQLYDEGERRGGIISRCDRYVAIIRRCINTRCYTMAHVKCLSDIWGRVWVELFVARVPRIPKFIEIVI
jgi:hypothetical protein